MPELREMYPTATVQERRGTRMRTVAKGHGRPHLLAAGARDSAAISAHEESNHHRNGHSHLSRQSFGTARRDPRTGEATSDHPLIREDLS